MLVDILLMMDGDYSSSFVMLVDILLMMGAVSFGRW